MELIYFAPVNFASYWQRPHYMADFMLRHGIKRIYWIDPYPTRLPKLSDFKINFKSDESVYSNIPGVEVIKIKALPLEPLDFFWRVNFFFWRKVSILLKEKSKEKNIMIGVGRPTKLAISILKKYPNIHSFMDVMDDFSEFYSGVSKRSMHEAELTTAKLVNRLIFSAAPLQKKYAELGHDSIVIPNGYRMDNLPSINICLKSREKIVGYVGTIGSWFDWDLVIEIAQQLPNTEVHIIGPIRTKIPADIPLNIKFFPECSKEEAIQRTLRFCVGLIPFKLNQLTNGVDPIKFYEMYALGTPVWSTSFGTMRQYIEQGLAYSITSNINWSLLLNKSLDTNFIQADIEKFRNMNSWNSRFENFLSFIRSGQ